MEMQKYLGFMLGRVGFLTLVRKGLGCFGDSFGAEKTFWFLFPTASIGEMALGCALHAGSCSRALPQGSSWGTGRWMLAPDGAGMARCRDGGRKPCVQAAHQARPDCLPLVSEEARRADVLGV